MTYRQSVVDLLVGGLDRREAAAVLGQEVEDAIPPPAGTFVARTGDTMSGPLTVDTGVAQPPFVLGTQNRNQTVVGLRAEDATELGGYAAADYARLAAANVFSAAQTMPAILPVDSSSSIATPILSLVDQLDLASGDHVTLTNDSGTLTIASASDPVTLYVEDLPVVLFVDGSHTIKLGGDSSYVEINSSGHMQFRKNATVWDDVRVAASHTTRGPGSTKPDAVAYKTTLMLYGFDDTSEESLHFVVQLPHGWKEGSRIYPHVHWLPSVAGGTAPKTTVKWALEYSWANHGLTFGSPATVSGYTPLNDDNPLVADEHYMTPLKDGSGNEYIDGAGKTISSMLICRIYRDATDATYDTYVGDALLLEIDFHIECDTLGSDTESTK